MRTRLHVGGLRVRLALAIGVTALVAVVVSFIALERGTDRDLRDRIDSELSAQHSRFAAAVDAAGVRNAKQLRRVTNRYLRAQRYDPASRILLIKVKGYPIFTNQQDVVAREIERERERIEDNETRGGSSSPPAGGAVPPPVGGATGAGGALPDTTTSEPESDGGGGGGVGAGDDVGSQRKDSGENEGSNEKEHGLLPLPAIEGEAQAAAGDPRTLLDTGAGFSTIETPEAGQLRVLTEPIEGVSGRRLGTFRAADPLASVELTREGLRNTFLVVGIAALLLAIAVSVWLASVITRPLRKMAAFASAVDAGDLGQRLKFDDHGDEVAVLADSFDGMLDRLEQAFKRQQDFVSDASHELRTPLTVLKGQIELLRRGIADPAERDRTIATVLAEIDRMNRLVDDMLTLAQAEEGLLVRPQLVRLEDMFEDIRRDAPLHGDRNFYVEQPPGDTIVADPQQLEQVFRNLVRNAVKHTGPEGHVRIGASANGSRVRFYVSDDGPGIEPAQLARVFDRFHRTDGGRTRDDGGSGLGLAIARAIVEAHGGRIWAESTPGEGATILFDLPRRPSTAGSQS